MEHFFVVRAGSITSEPAVKKKPKELVFRFVLIRPGFIPGRFFKRIFPSYI